VELAGDTAAGREQRELQLQVWSEGSPVSVLRALAALLSPH
jgi:hypothetical protein